MTKPRLSAIFTVEYEANPQHYGTDDLHEMAAIDRAAAEEDPSSFLGSFGDVRVIVEPVEVDQ